MPSRCVLVANSARFKSSIEGFVVLVPKTVANMPAKKPRTVFVFR